MAISTLTTKEFIIFSRLSLFALSKALRQKSVNEIMLLRKNLQIALAIYSTRHKLDKVQLDMIGQLQFMENYCRRIYVEDMKKLLLKKYPAEMQNSKLLKNAINKKWENYVKKSSY